jgi:hypothetical protein
MQSTDLVFSIGSFFVPQDEKRTNTRRKHHAAVHSERVEEQALITFA